MSGICQGSDTRRLSLTPVRFYILSNCNMHIHLLSIFPDSFTSRLQTSLISKAQSRQIITFHTIDPRDFCDDRGQYVDDEIYGGGAGMLLKAKPFIDAVNSLLPIIKDTAWKVVYLTPSPLMRNQSLAYEYAALDHLIIISGRYEGIDERMCQYLADHYDDHFVKISLGEYILLGGEAAAMVVVESIVRLIPWVIKESASHLIESYDPSKSQPTIEYPHYTRPDEVYGYTIPPVLKSGHHLHIQQRRDDHTQRL